MLAAVATRTWNGLVSTFEWECSVCVMVDVERRRSEAVWIMTGSTVCVSELIPSCVRVLMTACALVVLNFAISLSTRSIGVVTRSALSLHVSTDEWERGALVGGTPDSWRKTCPANRAMTPLAVISKLCLVYTPMTGDAS